jgi:hypothetical protein
MNPSSFKFNQPGIQRTPSQNPATLPEQGRVSTPKNRQPEAVDIGVFLHVKTSPIIALSLHRQAHFSPSHRPTSAKLIFRRMNNIAPEQGYRKDLILLHTQAAECL